MGKNKKNDKSNRKRKVDTDDDVDLDVVAPNEPSNSQQRNVKTKKSKNTRRNSVSRQVMNESFTQQVDEEIELNLPVSRQVVSERFVEDDEVVEMEIHETNSELLGEGDEEGEITDVPELTTEDEESENEEVEMNENGNATANRRSVERNNGRGNIAVTTKENYDEEELDPQEMKSMMKLAKFLQQQGFLHQKQDAVDGGAVMNKGTKQQSAKKSSQGNCLPSCHSNQSETTIYKGAVVMEIPGTGKVPPPNVPIDNNGDEVNKRLSSSSEEFEDVPIQKIQVENTSLIDNHDYVMFQQFLEYQRQEKSKGNKNVFEDDRNKPSTSQDGAAPATPKERPKDMIQQADKAKAVMYQIPGKEELSSENRANQILAAYMADEGYDLIENHVDQATRHKIVNFEFIDLARLIPKDRVQVQQDNRMVQVNRDGQSFYEPANLHEIGPIGSYNKWELAFRIYYTIIVAEHPGKAKELMQYNHTIYTASMAYQWDNVYAYDIDFRLHISRNPERSWGVILNLAWNTRLNEKLKPRGIAESTPPVANSAAPTPNTYGPNGKKKLCWKYNRGKCTYGFNCKFDHRCGVCFKFGHGAQVCRKAKPPSYQATMKYYDQDSAEPKRDNNNHNNHRDNRHRK